MSDDSQVDRAVGCWLGQLCGDALGSIVEFSGAGAIRRRYPGGLREIAPSPVWNTIAGQPTDDSELALMLARTLVRDGGYDVEAVCEAYCRWMESDPFDIGGTIGQALRAASAARRTGSSPVDAAHAAASPTSQANGALMRQSPLGIWGHGMDEAALTAVVADDTRLTHPHPICVESSQVFITTLAAVIEDGLSAEAAYERALDWMRRHGREPAVLAAVEAARTEPPGYTYHAGHVIVALQNAFYMALHTERVEDGVVRSVMGGGDTDTNAAIAGALLGALHGATAIPAQWNHAVYTCRPQEGAAGVEQPRPRAFWPCDAPIIARQLLAARRR